MAFKGEVKPNWCPGCGDYGLLSTTVKALETAGYLPHQVVIVSGIGCSSNFPHFTSAYGFHTVHGRALPAAMAIKLSNPDLKVIAVGGDGDGYGIGVGHLVHAIRRNIDITYMVMNNQIYGLTLGQASPTSTLDHITTTTPQGVNENPINPISLSLGCGSTFTARGFSGKTKHLQELISKGMKHKGFSFIDVLSPCVTFNKLNTYDYFKKRIYDLNQEQFDSTNVIDAYQKSFEWNEKIPIGIFYQNKNSDFKPNFNPIEEKISFSNLQIEKEEIYDLFK